MNTLRQIINACEKWERAPKHQQVLILIYVGGITIVTPLFIALYGFIYGRGLILSSKVLNLTPEEAHHMHSNGGYIILLSLFIMSIGLYSAKVAIEYWYDIKNLINK